MSDMKYREHRIIVQKSMSGAGWYAMIVQNGPRTNDAYYDTADEAMQTAKKAIDRELEIAAERIMANNPA